jgi:phage gp16-like protein
MLAKVHLGAKELGLDEDGRRDVLERVTGHRSSADCNDDQLDAVLREYRRLGWEPLKGGGRRPSGTSRPDAASSRRDVARSPMAGKARAMWVSLWHLGVVRSGSEASLEAFGRRQLGVDRLAWADQSQGFRLIEALKAMAERAGWNQDVSAIAAERRVWALKARLVQRQAEVLGRPPVVIAGWSERDLDRLAAEMGPAVRAKAGGD